MFRLFKHFNYFLFQLIFSSLNLSDKIKINHKNVLIEPGDVAVQMSLIPGTM